MAEACCGFQDAGKSVGHCLDDGRLGKGHLHGGTVSEAMSQSPVQAFVGVANDTQIGERCGPFTHAERTVGVVKKRSHGGVASGGV